MLTTIIVIMIFPTIEPPYLGYEDAEDHPQLVKRAQGPPQRRGGDLPHVHGHEARGQAGVEAHDEAARDQHLPGCRRLGQAHEGGRHEG